MMIDLGIIVILWLAIIAFVFMIMFLITKNNLYDEISKYTTYTILGIIGATFISVLVYISYIILMNYIN
jgi:hypothetical protein|nr:MAG TPA: hypothetical protein [Crassvirales sp.]